MDDKEFDLKEKKAEYKRNYQRNYYQKKKQDPAYLEKIREKQKENYSYTRQTIDCRACGIRHRPESLLCVLVKDAVQVRKINAFIASLHRTASE
jgi:hypothetical protein